MDIAQKQKGDVRDQTVGDVVCALSLVGDLDTALAAASTIQQLGSAHLTRVSLAAVMIARQQLEAAIDLLEEVHPTFRLRAFELAGRLSTVLAPVDWIDQLCERLPDADRLGILVGYGSALQDRGQYAEAAKVQQDALDLCRSPRSPSAEPVDRTRTESITEDLAVNLARIGESASALTAASLLKDVSAKNRVIEHICVCRAEKGDLQGFRTTLALLSSNVCRAATIATSAAALACTFPDTRARWPESPAGEQTRSARQLVEELIRESIQVARQSLDGEEKDQALWRIASAAKVAGFPDAAFAAVLLIQDPHTREIALDAATQLRLGPESDPPIAI